MARLVRKLPIQSRHGKIHKFGSLFFRESHVSKKRSHHEKKEKGFHHISSMEVNFFNVTTRSQKSTVVSRALTPKVK